MIAYGEYCVVRTLHAGAFAGILGSRDGTEVFLQDARRLWYWEGAASLSQLAMEGVKKPDECKFPCKVPRIFLSDVVEIIPTTEAARKNIEEVPVWAAEDLQEE